MIIRISRVQPDNHEEQRARLLLARKLEGRLYRVEALRARHNSPACKCPADPGVKVLLAHEAMFSSSSGVSVLLYTTDENQCPLLSGTLVAIVREFERDYPTLVQQANTGQISVATSYVTVSELERIAEARSSR